MNKNKLIHDFLEIVSRGDVKLICDHITEVHSILGNLDFQHPKTGNTPLITAAEENLTEVQGEAERQWFHTNKQGIFRFGFQNYSSSLLLSLMNFQYLESIQSPVSGGKVIITIFFHLHWGTVQLSGHSHITFLAGAVGLVAFE